MRDANIQSRRSPEAHAMYRALVDASKREPAPLRHDIDLSVWDEDRNEMTDLESYVFGIDPALQSDLAWAHERYTDMTGWTNGPFASFRDQERNAFPALMCGEGDYVMDDALAFMTHVCGVPRQQALLWVARVQVQAVRSGLVEDCPDTPG